MDRFGSRWRNYREKIPARWRETVRDGDTVILPGDLSWGMTLDEADADLRFLEGLPGQKILLKGNHDYWWPTSAKFQSYLDREGFSTIRFLYNSAFLCESFIICGTRGWYSDARQGGRDEADDAKILAREAGRLTLSLKEGVKLRERCEREDGTSPEILAFLHYPPLFADTVSPELIGVLERFCVRRCYFGHIHGVYSVPALRKYKGMEFRLISSDYLDFYPFWIDPLPPAGPDGSVHRSSDFCPEIVTEK